MTKAKSPKKRPRRKTPPADEPPPCERVWMVYNPNGCPPRITHRSKQSATDEAQRLATANPGETFIVFAPIAAWRAPAPHPVGVPLIDPAPEAEADDDDIPF